MIPRVFHRIWLDEPAPRRFEPFWRRLRELHPEWELVTWDSSEEVRGWIRNRALFDRFIESDPYGRIPDILRYEILYRHGGVYIDADVEPLCPFDPLLITDTPFVGWEDDRCFCTAVMGAPPGHPAILDLIETLPQNIRRFAGTDPVQETGPSFVMSRWRHRSDVRRLPPSAFYPVHWEEMDRLWRPYPEHTFAVHHWAAGWKVSEHEGRVRGKLTKEHVQDISLLVPYRSDGGRRDEVWAWLEQYWQTYLPETEIVLGDDRDGTPFSRAAALNDAASRALGSYLVVANADVFVPVNVIRRSTRAIAEACRPTWFVPVSRCVRLSEEATRRVLDAPLLPLPELPEQAGPGVDDIDTSPKGMITVLTRRAWETAGGFDHRFRGWCGGENRAFHYALDTLYASPTQLEATAWHLYHDRTPWCGGDRRVLSESRATTNDGLLELYRAAHMRPAAMRAAIASLPKPPIRERIGRWRRAPSSAWAALSAIVPAWLADLALALVAVASLVLTVWMLQINARLQVLVWDEAARVGAGAELAACLPHRDLGCAWDWLHRQTFYPFVLPMVHGILMALGVEPLAASWLPSLAAFALAGLLLARLARVLGMRSTGVYLAVALYWSCPFAVRLAAWGSLEHVGACVFLLVVLALALLERRPSATMASVTGLIVSVPWFLKWDYGIVAWASLLLSAVVAAARDRRRDWLTACLGALLVSMFVVVAWMSVDVEGKLSGALAFIRQGVPFRPLERDLLYYLKGLFSPELGLSPLVAALSVAGIGAGAIAWRRRKLPAAPMVLLLAALPMYSVSKVKDLRYLAPFIPVLALLAAATFAKLLSLARLHSPRRWLRVMVPVMLCAVLAYQLAVQIIGPSGVRTRFAFLEPSSAAVRAVRFATDTLRHERGPALVVGWTNQLSPPTFELAWSQALGTAAPDVSELVKEPFPSSDCLSGKGVRPPLVREVNPRTSPLPRASPKTARRAESVWFLHTLSELPGDTPSAILSACSAVSNVIAINVGRDSALYDGSARAMQGDLDESLALLQALEDEGSLLRLGSLDLDDASTITIYRRLSPHPTKAKTGEPEP